MRNSARLHTVLTILIGMIWVANGMVKILSLTERHELIVARILGGEYAHGITQLIGFGELALAGWVFSRFKARYCAYVQIALVATMNTLEFMLAPDLLLWGRLNAVFAFLLILLIYFNSALKHTTAAKA